MTAVLPTFLHVQSQFLLQLERAAGLDLRRVKVRAISGLLRLSLGAVLAQAAAHERRHIDQARRVRRDAARMITDLVQIRTLGEKKRDENLRFRQFIKSHSHSDRTLRRIAEEIEEQIDCTACANCCKVASTAVSDRDVERLARYLRISTERFLAEYTMEGDELDEGRILKQGRAVRAASS